MGETRNEMIETRGAARTDAPTIDGQMKGAAPTIDAPTITRAMLHAPKRGAETIGAPVRRKGTSVRQMLHSIAVWPRHWPKNNART